MPLPSFITLMPVDPRPRLATPAAGTGLERFRTVAFDTEVIRGNVDFDRARGCLECGLWIDGIVPECYREQIRAVVVDVHDREFRGRKWEGAETLDEFVYRVREEIWARIEPVMP